MNKVIVVTGANGFVGSHLVDNLLQAGYNVRCLLRPHSKLQWLESLPVEIIRVDYFNSEELQKALTGCRAVLHFGGATKAPHDEAYRRANTLTTKALLEAACHACPDIALFLLCSSQAALGPASSKEPLDETAPPYPITAYGRSKLEAEKICREYAQRLPITIVRPPAVYGPRDKDIFIFFKNVRWGIAPQIGREERFFSIVHVADLVDLTRLILEKPAPDFRVYHVTDGVAHSWAEVSNVIAAIMGKRPLRICIPKWLTIIFSRIVSGVAAISGKTATLNREKLQDLLQKYWLIDSQKAVDELGYSPQYDLHKGMEMTERWYRENGWL